VFHHRSERNTSATEQGFDRAGVQNLQRNIASTEDARFTAINISPRLNWVLDGGDTLTWQAFLNAHRFANENTARVDTPLGSPPQYPALDASMSNTNAFLRTDLNWVHKLASGSKLDMKIGGQVGRLGNTQHRDGFDSAGAQTLRSGTESKGTDRGISSTGKYTNPLVEGHALALGWDGGYNTRDDNRYEFDALRGMPVSDEVSTAASGAWRCIPRTSGT
jgi:outer membrane receptor for ferrienterochelin and colicins